jgi:Family of unknown function (DUF6173)
LGWPLSLGEISMNLGDMLAGNKMALQRGLQNFNDQQRAKYEKEQARHNALLNLSQLGDANLASEFHKRIVAQVQNFDARLDQEHEVGMRLVTFGQTITFHVTEIGFHNPSLMLFDGVLDSGDPVSLMQHVSQISFLLMKLKRSDPTQPKRKYGFAAH